MIGKTLIRVDELANRLGCCAETVRRMVREKQISGVLVRGTWKFDEEQVIRELKAAGARRVEKNKGAGNA